MKSMIDGIRAGIEARMHAVAVLMTTLVVALLASGCTTAPITGRSQFIMVPETEMHAMAATQYQEVLQSERVVTGTREAEMVKQVGMRIAAATDEYVRRNNLNIQFNWEFTLIDNEQVNAWCMPGGKIAFYTGIMPICKDENGVAVVMGHEVAHALARHGAERFSHALASQMGLVALDIAMREQPAQTKQLWMTAVGAGLTVGVMLPYGRKQEYEADHIGLILTAMAGYDPRGAVGFWERMAGAGGAAPPEFLSTHPGSANRIKNLQALMPEALRYYENRAPVSGGTGQ